MKRPGQRISLPGGPKRTPPKRRKTVSNVTDHAVLRYMERVMGLDIESVRRSILTAENVKLIEALQHGKFPIGGGHMATVVDGVIVTIV